MHATAILTRSMCHKTLIQPSRSAANFTGTTAEIVSGDRLMLCMCLAWSLNKTDSHLRHQWNTIAVLICCQVYQPVECAGHKKYVAIMSCLYTHVR